ncbi:3-carboxy-cis,cis-muconate cycloisomerase [Streptomyces odonnellii]|uniref:3-carboxy-cis,cis-muconate cycloisomerase n=1 Tax=Streptomyces odonnellii TaxID=1417980 RepID=UPI0007C86EB8|nr:3-carboxy-cis,cis-muconate cycloisomerase [Streptomyces odonnellii]
MDPVDERGGADGALLAPVRAGRAAEAATGDRAVLQAMLDAEAALTRAQAAVGLAPERAARTVTAAARAERFDIRSLALRGRAGGNPVIPLVADLTSAVAELEPEDAEFVHQGATSQDIVDTALMLVAVRTLDLIRGDLERTADALGALAAGHRDTVMPGRTLTQHAVPTTFGLKAAGWRSLVLDARDRLVVVRASLPAQLGGAAGTLAAFRAAADGDPDMERALTAAFAYETGLAEPALPWHVLRTPVADLAGALAFCAGALGKIAADVLVLSRTEIGEVAEGTGGASSAMPHKQNPVRAALVASAARQVPALAAVLFSSLAAEDERPAGAWHAEWQPLLDALRLTGGAAGTAAELSAGLRVFPARMRANLSLTGGRLLTERLTAHLTPLLGRAMARDLLTTASRRATDEGKELAEALAEDPRASAVLSPEKLRELTVPETYVGAAPGLTDRALSRPTHSGQDQDLGPVRRIFAGPERLARHLAALSESSEYVQYEDNPPPCDAPP